jgi:hypothetical protein
MSAARGTIEAVLMVSSDDTPSSPSSSSTLPLPSRSSSSSRSSSLRQFKLRMCAKRTAADVCAAMIPIPSAQAALLRLGGGGRGNNRVQLGGAVLCWVLLALVLSVHFSSPPAEAVAEADAIPADDTAAAVASGGVPQAAAAEAETGLVSFPLLLVSLGGYWLLSAGLLFGTVQLSGAALPSSSSGGGGGGGGGYRSALHVMGYGSFAPLLFPGAMLYYVNTIYMLDSSTQPTLEPPSSTPSIALGDDNAAAAATAEPAAVAANGSDDLQAAQLRLWAWCVGVAGMFGAVSAAVRIHSMVWHEYHSSHRCYQTGNIQRDRWRNKVGRGREQAEAGARRGARAGALVALSCVVCLLQQLV